MCDWNLRKSFTQFIFYEYSLHSFPHPEERVCVCVGGGGGGGGGGIVDTDQSILNIRLTTSTMEL